MIAAFAVCPYVVGACQAAGVSRQSHYTWLQDDPAYAKAIEEAKEEGVERLEREAERRAREGLLRKKFTKGGEPILDPETGAQYAEREYSDTLLIFLLKAARPEKYRERIETQHSGEVIVKVIRGERGRGDGY